ncbi:MAG: SH3 domain-containing protein [Desulfamplus sp.]|nr:SH3 domain-containing protein [Desulfamplus sp.]
MKMSNVIVKQGALRSQPSFISQLLTNINYGEAVEISSESNGWSNVRVVRTGQRGWIHNSALSEKAIKLKSGGLSDGHSATGDELALAGKGFNKQVEQQYKSRNPKADFTWINKMEAITISDAQIHNFLIEGQVTPNNSKFG